MRALLKQNLSYLAPLLPVITNGGDCVTCRWLPTSLSEVYRKLAHGLLSLLGLTGNEVKCQLQSELLGVTLCLILFPCMPLLLGLLSRDHSTDGCFSFEVS